LAKMEDLADLLMPSKRRGRDSTEKVAKYFTVVSDRSSKGNNTLKCGFCNKEFKGSSTRMRGHLAGARNGVAPCPSVPADIKAECVADIEARKEATAAYAQAAAGGTAAAQQELQLAAGAAVLLRAKRHDHEWVHKHFETVPNSEGNRTRCCKFCGKKFMGSATRMRSHLAGTRNGVAPCSMVPEAVREASLKSIRDLNEFKVVSQEQLVPPPPLSAEAAARLLVLGASPSLSPSSKRQRTGGPADLEEADLAVANFFHLYGLPVQAASGQHFKAMVAKVACLGAAYEPPHAETMLAAASQAAKAAKDKALEDSRDTGLTLTTVAMHEPVGRIVGVVAITWKGSHVLSVSREAAADVASLLGSAMEALASSSQATAVPLVLLDYDPAGASHVATAAALQSRFPSTSVVCCAAQAVRAVLKHVAELPAVKQAAADADASVRAIACSPEALEAFHAASQEPLPLLAGEEVLSAGSVAALLERFAAARGAVEAASKSSGREALGSTAALVESEDFWAKQKAAAAALSVVWEAVKALQDAQAPPSLGKVYAVFSKMLKSLAVPPSPEDPLQLTPPPPVDAELRQAAAAGVSRHWDAIRHDIHAAAYALDPLVWDEDTIGDSLVSAGFYRMLAKVAPSEAAQDLILKEYRSYKAKEGMFGLPLAQRQAQQMRGDEWWLQFGAEAPNLRRLAVSILKQVGASSLYSPPAPPPPPVGAEGGDDLIMLRLSLQMKETASQGGRLDDRVLWAAPAPQPSVAAL